MGYQSDTGSAGRSFRSHGRVLYTSQQAKALSVRTAARSVAVACSGVNIHEKYGNPLLDSLAIHVIIVSMESRFLRLTDGKVQKVLWAAILLCSQSTLTAIPTIAIFSEMESSGIALEGVAIDSLRQFQWWSEEDGHRILGAEPLDALLLARVQDEPPIAAARDAFWETSAAGHRDNLYYITAGRTEFAPTPPSISIDQRLASSMFGGEMSLRYYNSSSPFSRRHIGEHR
jgi:hypothetical protein